MENGGGDLGDDREGRKWGEKLVGFFKILIL